MHDRFRDRLHHISLTQIKRNKEIIASGIQQLEEVKSALIESRLYNESRAGSELLITAVVLQHEIRAWKEADISEENMNYFSARLHQVMRSLTERLRSS